MAEPVEQVLSEFIDAWNAGQRPRVREYVERVPEAERDALAGQIATWLEVAPSPELSGEAWDAVRAEPAVAAVVSAYGLEPEPLAELVSSLRAERGLERGELAARLAEALGVPGEVPKVEAYVQGVEQGSLDPRGLTERVLEAIAGVLGVARSRMEAAADAVALPLARPAAAAPLFRAADEAGDDMAEHLDVLAAAIATPAPEPWDEVDRLFRGGR